MDSLKLFASEVMPEFPNASLTSGVEAGRSPGGKIKLAEIDTSQYTVYSSQTPTNRQQMESELAKLNV
jgi:hypothetical protein